MKQFMIDMNCYDLKVREKVRRCTWTRPDHPMTCQAVSTRHCQKMASQMAGLYIPEDANREEEVQRPPVIYIPSPKWKDIPAEFEHLSYQKMFVRNGKPRGEVTEEVLRRFPDLDLKAGLDATMFNPNYP